MRELIGWILWALVGVLMLLSGEQDSTLVDAIIYASLIISGAIMTGGESNK